MNEKISQRFKELLEEGERLINSIPIKMQQTDLYGNMEEVPGELTCRVDGVETPKYQQWLSSAANLINYTVPNESYFTGECNKILADEELKGGIPSHSILKMFGLLKSAKDEWEHGMLGQIEFNIAGATFDDFLDHAAEYHKGNKKTESSVLASAVLEDKVKKICRKNSIEANRKKLDNLIDELAKKEVLTPVKAKRVKSFAGVRNHALHAEWDNFDISDVGALIKGTRELIEEFL